MTKIWDLWHLKKIIFFSKFYIFFQKKKFQQKLENIFLNTRRGFKKSEFFLKIHVWGIIDAVLHDFDSFRTPRDR